MSKGHLVAFIDGDRSNVTLENLELITRRESAQINKLRCYAQPTDIQPTVRLIGKLKARLGELEESKEG